MKIAINGFGRIGRIITRELFKHAQHRKNIQLVAINDLSTPQEMAFGFKYDSTHGIFPANVSSDAESITIDGTKIPVLSVKDATQLPWKNLGVDIVFECTGRYTDRADAAIHLNSGAKRVIVSAPSKGADATIVMGVNHESYNPAKHTVVSNASCTTNCLAPIVHVLHNALKIKNGYMTTIHSYTSDQRLLDNAHKDPRRARAAALNMIPTSTGAAKAVGEVIPELKGKLDGLAVRVPTPNVSLTDVVLTTEKITSKDEVNQLLARAAEGELKGFLGISREPLVSSDFNGNSLSSIVDADSTSVMNAVGGGSLVKVLSWYDNETGFSLRMLDLASFMAGKGL